MSNKPFRLNHKRRSLVIESGASVWPIPVSDDFCEFWFGLLGVKDTAE
ncbi:MAG: hypothetical protein HRF49_07755 [bacterium]|jgi:hypothetical protein